MALEFSSVESATTGGEIARLVAPFLPVLLGMAGSVGEKLATELGTAAFQCLRKLWKRLRRRPEIRDIIPELERRVRAGREGETIDLLAQSLIVALQDARVRKLAEKLLSTRTIRARLQADVVESTGRVVGVRIGGADAAPSSVEAHVATKRVAGEAVGVEINPIGVHTEQETKVNGAGP